jgi:hypothetical protein
MGVGRPEWTGREKWMRAIDRSAGKVVRAARGRSGQHELESRTGEGRRDGIVADPFPWSSAARVISAPEPRSQGRPVSLAGRHGGVARPSAATPPHLQVRRARMGLPDRVSINQRRQGAPSTQSVKGGSK